MKVFVAKTEHCHAALCLSRILGADALAMGISFVVKLLAMILRDDGDQALGLLPPLPNTLSDFVSRSRS